MVSLLRRSGSFELDLCEEAHHDREIPKNFRSGTVDEEYKDAKKPRIAEDKKGDKEANEPNSDIVMKIDPFKEEYVEAFHMLPQNLQRRLAKTKCNRCGLHVADCNHNRYNQMGEPILKLCIICYETGGHYKEDCPYPERKYCRYCLARGEHFPWDCPLPYEERKKNFIRPGPTDEMPPFDWSQCAI